MHIDPKSSANIPLRPLADISQTTGSGGIPAGASAEYSDGVQLSHLSSVLNGLAAGASAGAKQISSLTALFKAGTYQVNPTQLSQRMIDDALSA
jgi:hypothetical protein